MRKLYPIFLDIEGKKAVVIGGGPVAARKAGTLAEAGASVTIISPELSPETAALVKGGSVSHIPRKYSSGDLEGASVAVAATGDPDANIAITDEAKSAGVPVNSARPPSAGDFFVPSTINRGGLTVAISTAGGCPALAKRLKGDLDTFLGREYGPFLEFLEEARTAIKAGITDESARALALTRLVESDLIEGFKGDRGDALARGRAMLDGLLSSPEK